MDPRTEGLAPDPSFEADRFEDDGLDDGEGILAITEGGKEHLKELTGPSRRESRRT